MKGFAAFLGKELWEIRRTWRVWVVPGVVLCFAFTSPILAYVTPHVVASMVKSQPGLTIILPPATWADAYSQFLKNMSQIALLVVAIAGAGAVSGERAAGTAILTLTKPVSRTAFVAAKVLSQSLLIVASASLGSAICAAVTAAIFGPAPVSRLVLAVILWVVQALLLVGVVTLFSAWFTARGAAAGAGIGFLYLGLLVSLWPAATRYSFVGLIPAAGKVLSGQPVDPFWPVATGVVAAIAFAAGAAAVFERQEL